MTVETAETTTIDNGSILNAYSELSGVAHAAERAQAALQGGQCAQASCSRRHPRDWAKVAADGITGTDFPATSNSTTRVSRRTLPRTKKGARRRPFVRQPRRSALDEWALAFVQRPVGLVTGHGRDQLVDVVLALGLGRRLDLKEIHVAHQAAIFAQLAILGHDVVDRDLAHLGHHRLGVVGAGRLHGLEIVRDRAVDAGRQHAGDLVAPGAEALGPGAGLVVEIPVE